MMQPPFNLSLTAIRMPGKRLAELNCFMQTSALAGRKIRGLCYDSVSVEGNVVTIVTRPAASVVGGRSYILSHAVTSSVFLLSVSVEDAGRIVME